MELNTILTAVALGLEALLFIWAVYLKEETKSTEGKLFVGAIIGLFFGIVVGSAWVGADIVLKALTVDRDQYPLVRISGDLAIIFAVSTTVVGTIGGVVGAMLGKEGETNRAAILGAVIGAIVGIVIVRIPLSM